MTAFTDRIRGIRQIIKPGFVIGRGGLTKGNAQQVRISSLLSASGIAAAVRSSQTDNTINGIPVTPTPTPTDQQVLTFQASTGTFVYQLINTNAQNAVAALLLDSPEIHWTVVANASISASIINNSIVAARLHATQTSMLFGRSSAGAGPGEEITLGAGLTISGGVLSGSGGPTGPAGAQGTRGPIGFNGEDGEDGTPLPGPMGFQGIQGIQGITGVAGTPGFPGEDGEDGMPLPGPRGFQGIQGINGPPGYSGDDGDDGFPGNPGAQGIQGIQGTAGTNGTNGSSSFTIEPQGRLTLATGTPVMSDIIGTGFTTVYYTPYKGVTVPLFDGVSVWTQTAFSETSQALSDTTKSPAATAANNLYDYFAWMDAGTFRVTRGPHWSTLASRGTGVGTTELIRTGGFLLNKNAITNGPGAQKGTYVGTINIGSTNNLWWIPKSAVAGGGQNRLDVWNMYNRVMVTAQNIDTNTSYNYTLATWQIKDANAGNQIIFCVGLVEDGFTAINWANASNTLGTSVAIGVWLNASSGTPPAASTFTIVAALRDSSSVTLVGQPALGNNFVVPGEVSTASGTTTWWTQSGNSFTMFTLAFPM